MLIQKTGYSFRVSSSSWRAWCWELSRCCFMCIRGEVDNRQCFVIKMHFAYYCLLPTVYCLLSCLLPTFFSIRLLRSFRSHCNSLVSEDQQTTRFTKRHARGHVGDCVAVLS